MGNDGKLPAKDKQSFPRPPGGPEPSPLGDSRPIPNSNGALDVGYDYASSMPGVVRSDLAKGYCNRERIADAGSDGDEGA